MSERAQFPITGPRAGDHKDARQQTRIAQDALDGVKAQKRAAALRNPQADRFAENAKNPTWVGGFDERAGVDRTTK